MLTIKPSSTLKVMEKDEEIQYDINVSSELVESSGTSDKTIASVVFNIYNSSGILVNDDYNKGVTWINGVIFFGIGAFDVGKLKLEFIVTCNESLPDLVTPYEFIFYMYVKIKDI